MKSLALRLGFIRWPRQVSSRLCKFSACHYVVSLMPVPPPTQAGALGVFQLKRLWARHLAARQGQGVPPESPGEFALNHVLLCGLNLALEETLQYLMRTAPTFDEFERWVLEKNGGQLDPRVVARLNAAVLGQTPTQPLPLADAADAFGPVLTAADRAHWDEHGYVVVREAIPRAQAAATAQVLWQHQGMDPADPATWYPDRTYGIMVQLFHHPVLTANRRSPRVRRAFEEVWGTDDLWMTVDRVSFNPPEREGWPFPGPHIHWDADFATRPFPFATQGLIYLTDTPANQGAFACVPGFHRRMDSFLAGVPPGTYPQARDVPGLALKPIAAQAGDLVIWHHALPHGATANTGTQPRIVHYVNMLPTPRLTSPQPQVA